MSKYTEEELDDMVNIEKENLDLLGSLLSTIRSTITKVKSRTSDESFSAMMMSFFVTIGDLFVIDGNVSDFYQKITDGIKKKEKMFNEKR